MKGAFMQTFADTLSYFIQRSGMKQKTVSERAAIDYTHFNRILKGDRPPPKHQNIELIAETLNLAAEERQELIGENVFDVYAKPWNFSRIALPTKPFHMLWVKILIFKLMEKDLDPDVVVRFKSVIAKEPLLWMIYLSADPIDIRDGWYKYYL